MNDTYLAHHGVLGMKWGVRKDRRPDSNAKSANLDKWGSDANHNILYVTGLSGSGKSTTAHSLRSSRTNVISLDLYENYSKNAKKDMDPEFNKFLDAKKINYRVSNDGPTSDFFKNRDAITKAYKEFGKAQFAKGKKVVVEGVQLADDGVNTSSFKGQPFISMTTSFSKSLYRAARRDGLTIRDMDAVSARVKQGRIWNQNLGKLNSDLKLQQTDEFMIPYLGKNIKGN